MNESLMRWKPQPATVISLVALFCAIGGSAIAAGLAKNSVKSKQVKNESLKAADLKNNKAVGSEETDVGAVLRQLESVVTEANNTFERRSEVMKGLTTAE